MTSRLQFREVLVVYCLTVAFTIGLQWHNNAFASEFTSISDESAHYVTGLMLRDYILHGFPENPLAYATRYYDHYPRVGLGQWPPVFYVVQALWTIPFGVSRTSLILLMAVIGGVLLTTTYVVANRYFPRWLSASLVIFLASLPSYESLSSAVMSEILVALLVFWSVLLFEHYLRAPHWQTAAAFAVLASATILTKATGLALAPVPVFAAVLSYRSKPYRRPSFWVAAAVIAAICSPWFLLVPGALHERIAKFGGIAFLADRPLQTLVYLARELSFGGLVLAGVGMIIVFAQPQPNRSSTQEPTGTARNSFWMLGLLLFLSTFGLRMFIGAWEDRHLITLLPFFALFVGSGLRWVVDVGFGGHQTAVILSIVTVTCIAGFNIARGAPKQHLGLDNVAEDLVHDSRFQNARFLVASDSVGEGVFVAEVAMRERRLGHFLARGSKVLASDGFMGDNYVLKYKTPADVMRYLGEQTSEVVVIDAPLDPPAHIELLRQTIAEYKTRWRLLGSYPRTSAVGRDQAQIQVYAVSQ